MKATYKVMLLINAIVLALGIVGHFILGSAFFQNQGLSMLQGSALGVYILGIVAAFIITIIYIMVRYYKTMYTTEGYLTFTLPVSTTSIINAKVINGFIWRLVNTSVTIFSVFILISSVFFTEDIDWSEMGPAMEEFTRLTGVSFGYIVTVFVIMTIMSCLTGVLVYYFCLTVGQLWQKHKVVGAILTYIVIYVVNQVLTMAIMLTTGFSKFMYMTETTGPTMQDVAVFYQQIITSVIVESIVFSVIYYLGCVLISKKKVNLD